jgi:hypothetical protein
MKRLAERVQQIHHPRTWVDQFNRAILLLAGFSFHSLQCWFVPASELAVFRRKV